MENPGAVLSPRAELYVLDAEQRVVAGPLVITRRRAYHREWLLGLQGVTSRAVVEGWRDHLLGVSIASVGSHGAEATDRTGGGVDADG